MIIIIIWLVGLEPFLFFHILGLSFIIPTDFHIFSEGLKPPTDGDFIGIVPTTMGDMNDIYNHVNVVGSPEIIGFSLHRLW